MNLSRPITDPLPHGKVGQQTFGHGTHTHPEFWRQDLEKLLARAQRGGKN